MNIVANKHLKSKLLSSYCFLSANTYTKKKSAVEFFHDLMRVLANTITKWNHNARSEVRLPPDYLSSTK